MIVDRPRVSVVLPVRNGGDRLAAAVESIRGQTLVDWELIIINDGSTDSTPSQIDSLARQDSRIRVFHAQAQGVAKAMNSAVEWAREEFVARMDSDDVAFPDRLAEQVRFLQNRPDVDAVGSLVEFGGDRSLQGGYAAHVDWLNSVVTEEQISKSRFIESPICNPSVMFRAKAWKRYGGCRDGDFPEDYELWLRWLDRGAVLAKVPKTLLRWNDHDARATRTMDRYRMEAFYKLKAQYLAAWLPARQAGRVIWVWGAGRVTRRRVSDLESMGVKVTGFIDIDSKKWGSLRDGRKVVGPVDAPASVEAFVLGFVAKREAHATLRRYLGPRGFREGEDFVFAA